MIQNIMRDVEFQKSLSEPATAADALEGVLSVEDGRIVSGGSMPVIGSASYSLFSVSIDRADVEIGSCGNISAGAELKRNTTTNKIHTHLKKMLLRFIAAAPLTTRERMTCAQKCPGTRAYNFSTKKSRFLFFKRKRLRSMRTQTDPTLKRRSNARTVIILSRK